MTRHGYVRETSLSLGLAGRETESGLTLNKSVSDIKHITGAAPTILGMLSYEQGFR